MNKIIGLVLILSVGFRITPFVCATEGSHYTVSEVLKVRSLSDFDCKIGGYRPAPSATFRVQIRNVEINSQIPGDAAAEYLYERLKNAEHVVLNNIQFRNYFRVLADVTVDGRDLQQELVQQGFARSVQPAPANTAAKSQEKSKNEPPRRYQPYQPPVQDSRATTPRTERRVVTLQSLLDTEVDFSSVNDETPFAEALQILSQSVRPHLPLVILWNDLENNAMVSKDMPIGVAGVGKVRLKQAMELVLHSVSQRASTKVLLSVQGNVITIGTQKGLLVKSTARVYSVEDIFSVPFDENTDNRRNNQRN